MVRAPWEAELFDRHRIAIVLAVLTAPAGRASFSELARQLGLSDGNLACHLGRLQRVGIIAARRNGSRGRASHTDYLLTAAGRSHMEAAGAEFARVARTISTALAVGGLVPDRGANAAAVETAEDAPLPASARPPISVEILDERFSGID